MPTGKQHSSCRQLLPAHPHPPSHPCCWPKNKHASLRHLLAAPPVATHVAQPTWQSAGMTSPPLSATRSPGTSSRTGSFCHSPSRLHCAEGAARASSSLMADPAFLQAQPKHGGVNACFTACGGRQGCQGCQVVVAGPAFIHVGGGAYRPIPSRGTTPQVEGVRLSLPVPLCLHPLPRATASHTLSMATGGRTRSSTSTDGAAAAELNSTAQRSSPVCVPAHPDD